MTVDAHIHFWRLARGDNLALLPSMVPIYRDLEPPTLKPHLDAAGIDRIVVVQAAETLAENLYTLGLAKFFPWIAGVVGWIDPASASVNEEVAALAANPRFKGVRPVRDDNQSIAWMLDRRLEAGWRAFQQAGLVIDLLVQNPDELPLVTHFVRGHPEMSIVLDHCAKPDIARGRFEPWASDLAELARHETVACKFSGLLNCAPPGAGAAELEPYARHVLTTFGGRRVLWASDWPPLDLAANYGAWRKVSLELLGGLSADDRAAALGGNAERIYRLGSNRGAGQP
jgi:L-fuconolactonase